MTTKTAVHSLRLSRPRLTLGLVVGLVTWGALFFVDAISARLRFIAGWVLGTAAAMIAIFIGLGGATATSIKSRAIRQDAGKWAVLVATMLAAIASLVVIATEIPTFKGASGFEKAG